MMKYLDFHGTALAQIALGTNYFGDTIAEDVVYSQLDHYVAMGGNLIDTAAIYGQTYTGGPSSAELLIGKWLKSSGMRNDLTIASKGCHPDRASGASRLNEKEMLSDVHRSLEQLGVDQLDIWFLHRDDFAQGVDELIDLTNILIEDKLVRHIGASNWTSERIAAANRWAEGAGKTGFTISQIQWSLAESTPELLGDHTAVCMNKTEHAWYTETQLPVMAYAPQAKGLFSKLIAGGMAALNEKILSRFASERNLALAPKVAAIATERGVDSAAVVLAYLTSQKNPTIAIAGASRVEQLVAALSAADLQLSAEELASLS